MSVDYSNHCCQLKRFLYISLLGNYEEKIMHVNSCFTLKLTAMDEHPVDLGKRSGAGGRGPVEWR
jgi:hypothetical protein